MLGQKSVVRENIAMRYFFSLCPFSKGHYKESIISSQVPKSSTALFYLCPPAPSPTPGLSGSSLLFLVRRCHYSEEAIRQLSCGLGAPVQGGRHHTAPHGQGSVLFVILFSANTGTEKPRSTHKQIQSKETERQQFRGQSPKKMASG